MICHLLERCDFQTLQEPQEQAPNVADAITSSLITTRNGQTCGMGPNKKALLAALGPIMQGALDSAVNERWINAGMFKMGRIWHVEEEVRDSKGMWSGELWKGTWPPRKSSSMLDAVWHNNKSGREVRDTVFLDAVEHGKIVIHRLSSGMTYVRYYQAEHPGEISGRADSEKNAAWSASITY